MSLTLKVASLAVRTFAKPIANNIKRNAHEHERFRNICVKFAQRLHRLDMRMRLGLLQDPAVIDRQIAKEVKAAEAVRKKSQTPTVKTEAETMAEEAMTKQDREAAKKKIEAASKPRIRPLSEAKAIEMGANFVAEAFIFGVGISLIVFEQWRQRRKARHQRDDIREDVEELREEFKSVKAELEEMRARHPEPGSGSLLGLWKGKSENQKTDEKANKKMAEEDIRGSLKKLRTELKAVDAELESIKARHQRSTPTAGLTSLWKSKEEDTNVNGKAPDGRTSAPPSTALPPTADEK